MLTAGETASLMYPCQTMDNYVCALSRADERFMLCSQSGVRSKCGNNDQLLIDAELSLVHIEADDGLLMLPTTSSNVQSMAVENGAVFQEK